MADTVSTGMAAKDSERCRAAPQPRWATPSLQEDVEHLEEHIVERELASNAPDDTCLFRFRDALERAFSILSFAPHTCRRSAQHREFRELIIPFGHGGCVVLFAIRELDVVLLAARDPHEQDYR